MKHKIIIGIIFVLVFILCGCSYESSLSHTSTSTCSENSLIDSAESEKMLCSATTKSEIECSLSTNSITAEDSLFEYELCNGEVKILNVLSDNEEITVPESIDGYAVTTIGQMAFYQKINCHTIVLPKTLKVIESGAFYRCYNLKKITIPASVTNIEKDAFFRTSALESVCVEDDNSVYCDIDGILFTLDKTVLVLYPEGRVCEEYALPSNVIAVDELAFGYYPAIKRLIIGKTVALPESLSVAGTEEIEIVMQ